MLLLALYVFAVPCCQLCHAARPSGIVCFCGAMPPGHATPPYCCTRYQVHNIYSVVSRAVYGTVLSRAVVLFPSYLRIPYHITIPYLSLIHI